MISILINALISCKINSLAYVGMNQCNTLGWSSKYLLIYKMSISDYKQTIFVLKAPAGMVYNEIYI